MTEPDVVAAVGTDPGPARTPDPGPRTDTASQATLLSASGGAVGLLSYACTLVLAHLLDPAAYTDFAAAAALVGVAGVASSALIPLPLAHVVRARPAGSAVRVEAMTFAAAMSVLVGLVAGLLVGALAAGFAPVGVAVTAGASALALFAIAPVWGFLQGESRFRRYAGLAVGEVAVRLGVSVAAVLVGLGAAGAVGAFAVGAVAVLAATGRAAGRDVSPRVVRRVLADRARWGETGSVAAVQTVLSALAVADVVVAALVAHGSGGAGYQAMATLAKAPVYVAVGTALVSFPALRAATAGPAGAPERDRRLRDALAAFVRLAVPAVAVVATLPTALVGLVLPASYLPWTSLLPWLAAAGLGLGGVTVLATLLLAVRAHAALAAGLTGAVLALAGGTAGGLATITDAPTGLAHGTAVGALVGLVLVAAAGWRHRPASPPSLRAAAARGTVYAVLVGALLVACRGTTGGWVLAVVALGLALVGLPVVQGRVRAAAGPGPGVPPAPGPRVLHLGFEDPTQPGAGGGSYRTLEVDRRLAAAGFGIVIATTRHPDCVDRTERHGEGWIRWVHLGVGAGRTRLSRWGGYVLGVPFAVRAVETDLVVEDFFAPASSMGVPWFSPAPVVGVVQWLNAHEKASQYKVPVHLAERVTVPSHRRLVAVSRGVADRLAALAPRAEITVIGNGVDRAAFDTPATVRTDDVVFVGRLEIAQKGLDLLVDAWARLGRRCRDGRPRRLARRDLPRRGGRGRRDGGAAACRRGGGAACRSAWSGKRGPSVPCSTTSPRSCCGAWINKYCLVVD